MYDSLEVERDNKFRSRLVATGLSAGKARYYNPSVGRFISEDPQFHRQQLMLYLYGLNDAINNIDPLGLFSIENNLQRIPLTPEAIQSKCPNRTDHACTFSSVDLKCKCICTGSITWGQATLVINGQMYLPNITPQEESHGFHHEMTCHIDKGISYVSPDITLFESIPYPTVGSCEGGCNRTRQVVQGKWLFMMNKTEREEITKCPW